MMSKILLIVLIGCAVAFASPVKRNAEIVSQTGSMTILITQSIEQILKKLGDSVMDELEETFLKIGEHLNTKEYNDAFNELLNTIQKIDDAEKKLNKDQLIYLGNETKKVAEAYGHLIEDALEMMSHKEEGTVNAKEFTASVKNLKETADEFLS